MSPLALLVRKIYSFLCDILHWFGPILLAAALTFGYLWQDVKESLQVSQANEKALESASEADQAVIPTVLEEKAQNASEATERVRVIYKYAKPKECPKIPVMIYQGDEVVSLSPEETREAELYTALKTRLPDEILQELPVGHPDRP